MASDQVNTMNLADDGEGMVPLNDNPSTSFTPEKIYVKVRDDDDGFYSH